MHGGLRWLAVGVSLVCSVASAQTEAPATPPPATPEATPQPAPADESFDIRARPVEPEDGAIAVKQAAPWTPASPPSAGTIISGYGRSYFFGITPGIGSQASGLSSGTTGVTNLAGDLQAGFSGFVGGAWTQYLLDAGQSLTADARGRLVLGGDVDATGGSTESGFSLVLSIERAAGEYLFYGLPEVAGIPTFAGAWGGLSGGTAGTTKESVADAETGTRVNLPFRVSGGAGVGRVYPIHWRVTLKRIEAALIADGALSGPLPDGVAATVIAEWYAARERFVLPLDPVGNLGWSAHHALLGMLQIIRDAGLLKKPIAAFTAYRIERLLLDENAVDRWHGWDGRAGLRVRRDLTYDSLDDAAEDPPTTLAVEVLGRAYFNLSLESDLRFDPSASVALRSSDEAGNDLRGARRVSLSAAPAVGNADAFLPTGRVVVDLPVSYTLYAYDAGLDLTGYWTLHAGASAGLASSDPAFGFAAGASYTFLTGGRSGYTFGLNGGAGLKGGDVEYQINLVAVLGLGTGESFYTAPDQVGDTVPFDTSWMPAPGPRGTP